MFDYNEDIELNELLNLGQLYKRLSSENNKKTFYEKNNTVSIFLLYHFIPSFVQNYFIS